MIVTTTPSVEGRRIVGYQGLVTGESILGANLFRDLFASVRDIVGGRSGAYEKAPEAPAGRVQRDAGGSQGLGADAVVGVDLDYEVLGKDGQHADGDGERHGREARLTVGLGRPTSYALRQAGSWGRADDGNCSGSTGEGGRPPGDAARRSRRSCCGSPAGRSTTPTICGRRATS